MAEVTIEVRPNGLIPEPLPPDAPADFRLEIIAAVEGALPTGTSSGVPTREIVMSPRSVVRSSVGASRAAPVQEQSFFDPGTEPPQGTFQRAVWVGCARHIRVMMRVLPGQRAGPTLGPSAPRQPCCGRAVPLQCSRSSGGGDSRAPSTSRKALVIGPRIPPRGCLDKRIRTRLRRGASAHWRGSCG